MKLGLRSVSLRLRAPWVFAAGTIESRSVLLVELRDASGVVGYGEAAPLAPYDGVSLEDVRAAIEDCRAVLAHADGEPELASLLEEVWRLAVLPQAVAGVDVALWDLAARRAGVPVWRLLGSTQPPFVEVNGTITAADRAGAAAAAGRLRAAGFACLKLKVGLGDDAGRVAAVRAAIGPAMALRLDANGAWSVEEARATLRVLEPARIELCEEPVSGLAEIADVSGSVNVAIALDESAGLPGALEHRVCDAVCLKLARCGGISGLIEAAARARAAGYEVYLASTLDGPVGIAAALHAAAVVRPDRPCGLATLAAFAGRPDLCAPVAGSMVAPVSPGVIAEDMIGWYGGL